MSIVGGAESSSCELKANKNGKIGEQVDRISNLPDAIIHHILSFTSSTIDVVRTSVLAKRWRYLWTQIPNLHLDDSELSISNREDAFVHFVNGVLSLYKAPGIERYCLSVHQTSNAVFVDDWARFAVQRNVKELNVQIYADMTDYEPFEMPRCESVRDLRLHLGSRGLKLPITGGFKSLETLSISSVDFVNDRILSTVLKQCPCLKSLSFHNCTGLHRIKVTSPLLEDLDIRKCEGLHQLSVSAEKLQSLHVHDSFNYGSPSVKVLAPSLQSFNWLDYIVTEKPLSVLSNDQNYQDNLKKIALVGNDGNNGKLQPYVYDLRLLPISASTKDHFIKNPPVKLTLDDSCISDGIEEGGDGVWSIVGGKASCRRNFSLEVALLDALGRSVHKEMEIFASLVYFDSGAPVEKTNDNTEAPLLTSCDGLEFPTTNKPVTLLRGHANFKLKISQLSSKSDNRLFRVRFDTIGTQKYPFLEAYSRPIRCISRNRTLRASVIGRRPFSASPLLNEIHPRGGSDRPHVNHDANGGGPFSVSSQSELKCSPSLKRFKVDHDKSSTVLDINGVPKQDGRIPKRSLEIKPNNLERTDSAPSDSESTDAGNSESRWTVHTATPISDATIFRYCIEGLCERVMLLKDIINSSSNEDIAKFAMQVCLYTGCSHHRYQILMSKQLIQEESDTWNSISGNNCRVLWTDAVPEINKRFMKISCSTTRSLSGKDLEVLRGIAGCGEDLCRENFEKMWYWLYPVAFSLSNNRIYNLWECARPLWIEGLITKEEAENSLKGLQKPGTFVLRFPTSRSWPHPDAGSLVVTYVGADNTLHHKLLSLDLSSEDNGEGDSKQLHTMLLEEAELSQLARITRQGMPLTGAEG